MYKFIEHTADMGIEASGRTLSEAIEEVVKGLVVMIFGELPTFSFVGKNILVRAEDPVELLVSTLNEIVYHVETQSLVPAGLIIESFSETELHYRLEQLRLLQFVVVNTTSDSNEPPTVELHPLYAIARHGKPDLRTT